MSPLDLVKLALLLDRTRGRHEVRIGLIDGPVAMSHSELACLHMREIGGNGSGRCTQTDSAACTHGTFVAGILSAKRGSSAPAICPDCTLLLRPIFSEETSGQEDMPSAKPQELAAAIIECIAAGAHCINLSLALAQLSSRGERELDLALNHATQRGVMIVAAAGNQGMLGSSAITRHPWVIPVVACNLQGRPLNESNLGNSIDKCGLCAPGDAITSLNAAGQFLTLSGTSVAVPFVTGTIALLWSVFPAASAAQIKLAITQASLPRRASVVPPLLDAEAAYQILLTMNARR
ncbi:S8 family peptidase [Nitrosomonas communis]|uniref:Subtilase family protein n=1 Tax=Nitrosomonas communis TaxID=44574 RepID=A0A1I4TKT4_9PROT|nr:S8 family serine peptidase [Nitrosomonas communis]SFM77388.1 Subtilase family protein [Nitrosomonas communis]